MQQIAGNKARRQPQLPERLDQQPTRIAARTRGAHERFLGRLHAGFHADQVADLALQTLIQCDEKVGGTHRRAVDTRDKLRETRRHGPLDQVRCEFEFEAGCVLEGKLFRRRFEKEVERVIDSHLGDQVHGHLEFARLLGKHQTRLIVGERVLLPVDEVFGRFDPHRIRQNRGPAMRRRPETHDLGRQRNQPVVAVMCDMIQRDAYGHTRLLDKGRQPAKKQASCRL